jgi:ABC-type sugar transport system ATPase subunit
MSEHNRADRRSPTGVRPDPADLLSGSGLTKRYGRTAALTQVSFRLGRGDWLAVLGENGAGKSTLCKIIGGAVVPDSGGLSMDGRPLRLTAPRMALQAGIVTIPQELSPVADLTVAENVCLGEWPRRHGVVSRRAMARVAERELERLMTPIPVRRRMSELRLADLQLVEIARALARKAKVLVLDEPTAALSAHDSERLFRVLGELVAGGVGLVYISHRLDEIFTHCNRAMVLRDGREVLDEQVSELAPHQVVRAMLGRSADQRSHVRKPAAGPCRLRYHREPLRPGGPGMDLGVAAGEVTCLFGLRGSGCDEVIEEVAGARRRPHSEVRLEAAPDPLPGGPRAAIKRGVVYLPAERKTQGLLTAASIRDNLLLLARPRVARHGMVRRKNETALAGGFLESLRVRSAGINQAVGELSGGNQQKVLVGSRLAAEPKVLLMHEPTRGVDVGARADIHRLVRSLADQGMAILLVTSDVGEAIDVADRVIVMTDGEIAGELSGAAITKARALSLAAAAADPAVAQEK